MRRPLCMACLFYILGIACFVWLHPLLPPDYGGMEGMEITLKGRIYAKEYQTGDVPVYYLSSKELFFENQTISHKSNFILTVEADKRSDGGAYGLSVGATNPPADGETELPVGATVLVRGKLSLFEQATNPGQFDAASYYGQKGIYGAVYEATLLHTDGKKDVVAEGFAKAKRYLAARLFSVFGTQDGAVMKAVLLGDKTGMPKEVKSLYKDAGILHIMAVSGLHIGMFSGLLFVFFEKCGMPVWGNIFGCGFLLLVYGAIIGFPLSALRAMGMFMLSLVAKGLHRTNDAPTSLAFTAALILTANPYALFTPAFLLSYGAVCGIVFLKPALTDFFTGDKKEQKKMQRRRDKKKGADDFAENFAGQTRGLTENFLTSVSVFLFLLPLQLYFYFQVSIAGIFLNLAVIPLMSILLILGMLSLIPLTLAGPPGALLQGFFHGILKSGARGILQAYESGCILAERSGLKAVLGKPALWKVMLFYVLIVAFIWMMKGEGFSACDRRKAAGFLLLSALFLMLLTPRFFLKLGYRCFGQEEMRITFLDVGQGDCICMELPDGACFLFDCGSSSRAGVGEYRLIPCLTSRGIAKVDTLFLSHGDKDHINGAKEILASSEVQVQRVVLPYGISRDEPGFFEILDLAEERNIPVLTIKAGDLCTRGNVEILCLNPSSEYDAEKANESSLAFWVQFHDFTFLLTADISGEGEEEVTKLVQKKMREAGISEVTLLKVAHHGSRYSTSDDFLEVARPGIAVISCGKKQRYGHPHTETLERLSRCNAAIYRTDESGAVTVTVKKGKMKVIGYSD